MRHRLFPLVDFRAFFLRFSRWAMVMLPSWPVWASDHSVLQLPPVLLPPPLQLAYFAVLLAAVGHIPGVVRGRENHHARAAVSGRLQQSQVCRQGRHLGRCRLCQRDLYLHRVVSQLVRFVVEQGVQLRELQRVV